MTPTEEQNNILNANGRVIKINARAGTGKTAILHMIAEKYSQQRILYLVFNTRNRKEAKSSFPAHVDIHTIHSFALSASGCGFDGFGAVRPSAYINKFRLNKEALATLTSDFIVYFLNSTYRKPDLASEPFKMCLSDETLKGIFEKYQDDIIEIARTSLNSWYKTRKDCPHDFYLKISHLEGRFQSKLSRYDLVLVDEGQDLSPIMVDALSGYEGRIFLVGDSYQQIYSFRYAENAMLNFPQDEFHDLTRSFRFGAKIAGLTQQFISCGKEDNDFRISGMPGKKSQVYFYENLRSISNWRATAVLCRTNYSLFKNAMFLKARRQGFFFERDITGELFRTLDVYWLLTGERGNIKDELIRSFASFDLLEKYATTINDYQLQKTGELVRAYRNEFPAIVFEFLKRCQEKKSHAHDAVTLSTIHAAKGQEYDNVIIDDDVVTRLDKSKMTGSVNYSEEINVAYVGITRARKNLYLPAGMKLLFAEEWQDYTDKIPVVRIRDISRKELPLKKPASSARQAAYHTPPQASAGRGSTQAQQKRGVPELKVGDTLKTPNGKGKIVKIENDLYLVVVENQIASVWERRSALVRV